MPRVFSPFHVDLITDIKYVCIEMLCPTGFCLRILLTYPKCGVHQLGHVNINYGLLD